MIPFHVFSGAIVFIYATGIQCIPASVNFGNVQDRPAPTFFSIPMNLSPGIGIPNFNQVPGNITDLFNMLEDNAEISPVTRSPIVTDLRRNPPTTVKQENPRKREKPVTLTIEPVGKKLDDTPNKKQKTRKESLPQTMSTQKDKMVSQSGKPEINSPKTGYEEEEEYHVEEKHAKEEEKVISIPISVPVNVASTINDLLPAKVVEPKTDSPSKPELQLVPYGGEAKMATSERGTVKHSGKENREMKRESSVKNNPVLQFERTESDFDKLRREVGSQSRNKLANEEGKLIAIPSAMLADIFNELNSDSNKSEQGPTISTPVRDKSTQTERRIPSIPPPNLTLLIGFLKNIVPKLQTLDFQQQDKSTDKEDKLNSIPPKITDILNSFESMLNDTQKRVEIQPQNMFPTSPRTTKRPAELTIPILRTFDSGLGEPRQEKAIPVRKEEESLPVFEPVANIINAFLRPESRLDEPKQEMQPGEKESDLEPMVSNEEKKIFQIMYVKHMTFKLQIHMKVWHTFFSYISRDPEAANDCSVILTHVSKFYRQLTIDVEVVQRFRVLYKVVRMMTHNDQNLETFFKKTAKQPPKVDLEKVKQMKDAQSMEKWQNEIVTSLWKDAMSHFDDKLEHVENFFNDVLTNHERASSVLDLLPGISKRHTEYAGGKTASKIGNGFSIVDTEITQIRMRRKIYRDPNPSSLQSVLNE